ncbi:hypothetical protein PG994_000013 [Apiospora phragmitis]|uniref:2EXR domain-containing protein n=1 Tax=Apiospora phragmitis TaxID=2905665 RepID=A0ABR1X535_9PEZI
MATLNNSSQGALGMLGKVPPEIRCMIYEQALPRRILRVYRDGDNEHIFTELLAAPNLALVCRDAWYFCLKQYSQIALTPVWDQDKWHPRNMPRITDSQITWYNPSIDTLFVDILMSDTRMRRREPEAGSAAKGDQGETVAGWEVLENECFGNMVEGLGPIIQPLKKILFAAEMGVWRNQGWTQQVASITQVNRAKCPGSSQRSVKCEPLSLSRLVYSKKDDKLVPAKDGSILRQLLDMRLPGGEKKSASPPQGAGRETDGNDPTLLGRGLYDGGRRK